MTTLVVEDDKILRFLQAVLDPSADPARAAALRDYLSVDEPDPGGWIAALRAGAAGLFPARVVMAADGRAARAALAGADALVVERMAVGPEEIAAAPRLRLVHKFGVDDRNVDRAACAAAGIETRVLRRRVNGAVAEHALLLMMAVGRKLVETGGALDVASLEALGYRPRPFDAAHVAGANWARVTGLKSLLGATLGVLGLGEVGREVAARAAAMGARVLYSQRSRLPEAVERGCGAAFAPLGELLGRADFLCVCLPLDESTRGLVGRAAFARLKPGAVLVNVSRAGIVDREALLAALDDGRLGGAGLDVHYEEPGAPDEPLKAYRNVVLSPHVAVGPRRHAMDDMAALVADLAEALGA